MFFVRAAGAGTVRDGEEMRRSWRQGFVEGIGEDEVRGFERCNEVGFGERGS